MSLRKSPRLTPQGRAALRANAQKSTGPRTAMGKASSKLNALKHGRYASLPSELETMRALGEDPAEFKRLRRSLLNAFGPADPVWAKQVEDLANLYWRRARLERARAGMLQRELAHWKFAQERRHQRAKLGALAPGERLIPGLSLPQPAGPAVRLKHVLAFLETLQQQVKKRDFGPRDQAMFEELCGEKQSGPIAPLVDLLRRLADASDCSTPQGEAEYRRLAGLLEQEIEILREELDLLQREEKETSLAERNACLALEGTQPTLLLRQENALDRAIDRKVRILITLRDRAGNRWATQGLPSLAQEGEQGEARTREPEESEGLQPSPAAESNSPES